MTETELGRILLQLARDAIADRLGLPAPMREETPAWLRQSGATFVTLMQARRLRGCIGSLQAHRPLLDDVCANAVAAAFRDPRFQPLTVGEFHHTRVEVSLLSAQQALSFSGEADALAQLRPGIDGIVLEYGHHRSTFLPQVWEQLPRAEDFIAHLKVKAGLPGQFWHADVKLFRYTVAKWRE